MSNLCDEWCDRLQYLFFKILLELLEYWYIYHEIIRILNIKDMVPFRHVIDMVEYLFTLKRGKILCNIYVFYSIFVVEWL